MGGKKERSPRGWRKKGKRGDQKERSRRGRIPVRKREEGNLKKIKTLTWSPKAWRPMVMGLTQPVTRRGTLEMMMGERKTVPPRMLRIVPFGLFHIFFKLNSTI